MKNAREVLALAIAQQSPKDATPLLFELIRQDTYLHVREQIYRLEHGEFDKWLDQKCDGE